MISNQDLKGKSEIIIVGGGIAGLLAAFFAVRSGKTVKLYERSHRLGGIIHTRQNSNGMVEEAAHSLLVGPALKEVIDVCGIECDALDRHARSRYIIRSDKLRRWPLSPMETIGMFFRAYFVLSSKALGLVTVDAWARRHLGRAAANFLLTPFCRGIYGVDAAALCRQSVFKNLEIPKGHSLLSWVVATGFKKLFNRFKSKSTGPSAVRSVASKSPSKAKHVVPKYGMLDLVSRIEAFLQTQNQVEIHLNAMKTESDFANRPNSAVLMYCGNPHSGAEFFDSSSNRELGQLLSEVDYSALISCTTFVSSKTRLHELRQKFSGIGALASNETSIRPLGILFNSSAFNSRRLVANGERDEVLSFTFIFRLDQDLVVSKGETPELRTDAILREIRYSFDTLMGKVISNELEISIEGKAWQRAIPIYSIRHAELLKKLKEKCDERLGQTPNALALFGNYSGEVSIRGMAESAKAALTNKVS